MKKIKLKLINNFQIQHFAVFLFTLGLVVIVFSVPSISFAAPTIPFQGRLLQKDGVKVDDGCYTMKFSIYTRATGGTAVWSETYTAGDCSTATNGVNVKNSVFSVQLGTKSSLLSENFSDTDVTHYLGIKIGSDSEMSPRQKLGGSVFAFNANKLQNLQASDFLQKGNNLAELTDAGTARTSLGLGTLATQNTSAVTLTGGNINGIVIGGTTAAAGSFTTLNASGAVTLQSALNVAGASTLTGDTTISGASTLQSTLGVTGATTLSTLTTSGNATVGGTFGVTGATTLSGNLTASAGTTILGTSTTGALTSTSIASSAGITVAGTSSIATGLDLTDTDIGTGINLAGNDILFSGGSLSWTDASTDYIALAATSANELRFSSGSRDITFNTDDLVVDTITGRVGVGTASPTGMLQATVSNTAVTSASYDGYFQNQATNTTTDGINKYGAYITSTGSFTGSTGTATNNYGLYVDTITGADNNIGAYFADGIGIGITNPQGALEVGDGGEFALSSPNVVHGVTEIADSTNKYGSIAMNNTTTLGGLGIIGLSDTNGVNTAQTALSLLGVIGIDDPAISAVEINAAKASGTATAAIGATNLAFTFSNAGTPIINVLGSGYVGINTTVPVTDLHVNGGVCVTSDNNCANVPADGRIAAEGALLTNADLAEYYLTSGSVSAGDLVMVDPDNSLVVKKATIDHPGLLVGVISTTPGITLGSKDAPGGKPVVLAGRIPVNINLENGVISIGDRITISSVPGVGKKANAGDPSIGVALANATTTGQVMVLVNRNTGYQELTQQQSQFSENLQGVNQQLQNVNAQLNPTVLVLDSLKVTRDISTESLTVADTAIISGKLTVAKDVIFKEDLFVNGVLTASSLAMPNGAIVSFSSDTIIINSKAFDLNAMQGSLSVLAENISDLTERVTVVEKKVEDLSVTQVGTDTKVTVINSALEKAQQDIAGLQTTSTDQTAFAQQIVLPFTITAGKINDYVANLPAGLLPGDAKIQQVDVTLNGQSLGVMQFILTSGGTQHIVDIQSADFAKRSTELWTWAKTDSLDISLTSDADVRPTKGTLIITYTLKAE